MEEKRNYYGVGFAAVRWTGEMGATAARAIEVLDATVKQDILPVLIKMHERADKEARVDVESIAGFLDVLAEVRAESCRIEAEKKAESDKWYAEYLAKKEAEKEALEAAPITASDAIRADDEPFDPMAEAKQAETAVARTDF